MTRQAVADGRERDVGDTGGSEFQTQREAVDQVADLVDDRAIGSRLPAWPDRACSLHEQPHTGITERIERVFLFTRDAQGRATRDHDPGARRRLKDVRDVARRVEQVLEVVQGQQDRPILEVRPERLCG